MRELLKSRIVSISIMCICFLTIIPYLWAGCYACIGSDDFSSMLRSNTDNLFMSALHATQEIYLDWQGTFSSVFLIYYLLPYSRLGMLGIEIESVIVVILFFISIGFLTHSIVKRICVKSYNHVVFWFVFLLYIIYFLNDLNVSEIFYWHTGICVYTIPLVCCITVIAFLLDDKLVFKKGVMVFSCLLMILAGGGTLQVGAILCTTLVYLLVCNYNSPKKCKWIAICLAISLISCIINVSAPGNYVRRSADAGGEYSIIGAVIDSYSNVARLIIYDILDGKVFVLIVLLTFITVIMVKYDMVAISFTFTKWMICFVFYIILMGAANFPIALGYGNSSMPSRAFFIEYAIYSFGLVLLLIGAFVLIWDKMKISSQLSRKDAVYAFLLIMIFAGIKMENFRLESNMPLYVAEKCVKGDLKTFKDSTISMLKYIEESDKEEIVISELPDSYEILFPISLYEDPNWWVNRNVADYYGKSKVIAKTK